VTSENTPRSATIRAFLLERVDEGSKDPAADAAKHFQVTRTAANAHLRALVKSEAIEARGATRARRYRLRVKQWSTTETISPSLKEDIIWEHHVRPLLANMPENIRAICMYGFTEILNNAIDHSKGSRVVIGVICDARKTEIAIADDGVGIFHQIKSAFGLEDERYVILELAKGKLTTDPARHSGEGIYFSSRAFDTFAIISGRLTFMHEAESGDWQIEDTADAPGTFVKMVIGSASKRTMKALYDKSATEDDSFGFSVTHVPVSLAKIGPDNLISRSQAKRLVSRFERFQRVVLDFTDVTEIGQAFADEVFRVFPLAHPNVTLIDVRANSQVESMIARARAAMHEMTSGDVST
jgi:anti-sigma regulatory factor (Ser/Thr protein kinase)